MMPSPQTTKVAILGAGKGGCALLDLLASMPGVALVGVADKDPASPGLARAAARHIATTHDVVDLVTDPAVDLIVDVTGDPAVPALIGSLKRPGTEVLGGAAARLLWQLVRHETLMQAQVLSAERLAGVGTFTSGLAHDVNNPLHLILGLAENLLDEQDPAAIRDQAREIIHAVQRISGLTKELTRYARRSPQGAVEEVELASKLDEALKMARYATVLQDLSVVRSYTAKPVIKANPDDILHVFVNLLTNAIHAMNGKGTLSLATEWFDHRARVTISDTGCGIAKEDLEQVFEPFYTTKPPGQGTGLGLHNVRTIVNSLDGDISIESEVGKGTTVRLELPKS